MPVDDAKIQSTHDLLETLGKQKRDELTQIAELMTALKSIRLVSQTTNVDGKIITENVMPVDKDMADTMSEPRRQEIYDSVISKAEAVLGIGLS